MISSVLFVLPGVPAGAEEDLYEAAVLADGAAVYYRFGEASGTTADNAAGSGVNGTYSGSPELGHAPLLTTTVDTSVGFDGANDKVNLPSHSLINRARSYSAKTIELWFSAADVTSR